MLQSPDGLGKFVRAFALVVGLFLVCGAAHSETDVLLRTVGFALTDSDDSEPKVIGDRANCVFAIKNDVFHLNNVQFDRIKIQRWASKNLYAVECWVTVQLHGDDVGFEETTEPAKDDGSEFMRQLRQQDPTVFQSHHYTYKEHEWRG